ncbi:MAG: hypothetical protein DRH17_13630 [Deltaproteobacteria bacterium]|nr:MAG: hypothetical protein DRH17_13630 [Deltaproteobacteria bacterium]
MDRTLQTIGIVLLVAVLFISVAVLAQNYMNIPIIEEIRSGVSSLVGFLVPSYNLSIEPIAGTLIEGTKTVHYYVENATGGKVDIAKVTLETDKAIRLVLEVVTDIENASISASIVKTNAIVVKDIEQTGANTYLLKLTIYPAFESEGASVPSNVTSYTTKVEVTVSVDIPSGATGYVSVRVAEATYI